MFEQTKLKYDYKALEPYIDELTMITHYSKHHAAYTKNFNDAVAKLPADWAGKSAFEILAQADSIEDAALKGAIKNNGGGYYNHNLYFDTMSPNGGGAPKGKLAERINKDFGSFDALKEALTQASLTQFGSGWAWLVTDKSGALSVAKTSNQDSPITSSKGASNPILGIDVWEHAYYLKYKNLRGDYVKEFFNVVDWDAVAALYSGFAG